MDLSGTRIDGNRVVFGGHEHPFACHSTRRSAASSSQHVLARLANDGTLLHYTPQNIAEMWNAMTRPTTRNGLGLSVVDADREVRAIETGMILLPDSEAVYREWRRIIVRHSVLGVQVHDARLAASMIVHGVLSILTFNVADFSRFTGLTALHPSNI